MSQVTDIHDSTLRVAHLTTVDLSLRFLLWPQLLAVNEMGGESMGISSPGPWVPELQAAGVRHIPLQSSTRGVSLISDLRAAGQLWREIRRNTLTVLHTHNPKPGIYGRILGRLAGVPVVVNTLHGFYATEDDPLLKRIFVYGLEAIAARFSDVELHQNPEDLALAKRLRIVRRDRARLLGNGINLARFDPSALSADARSRVREELGVAPSDIVVGSVGRLVAEKGFPELFEIVGGLGEGIVCVVVGPIDADKPDALPPSMIEEARSRGVRFLGMRTDIEDLYAAMDIFVLPSHREGFPRAAMEAAAMGLPIVATNIRGCRQVVDPGVNGTLVPVRDPKSLARAIQSLADDRELRSKMGAASRRIAIERFDETAVVAKVMETYRDVLTARGMSHLIPVGMIPGGAVAMAPRPAHAEDAFALANLHFGLISGSFLPRMGRRFMVVLYRSLLAWPGAKIFVVEDICGVAGFVVAAEDASSFYRWFARRSWLVAGLAAFPAILRPGNAKRLWRSLRYRGKSVSMPVPAEILALGVAPRARGRELSGLLVTTALEALEDGGIERVGVLVASDNAAAISAFEKTGFVRHDQIELHRGERSEVMVWSTR